MTAAEIAVVRTARCAVCEVAITKAIALLSLERSAAVIATITTTVIAVAAEAATTTETTTSRLATRKAATTTTAAEAATATVRTVAEVATWTLSGRGALLRLKTDNDAWLERLVCELLDFTDLATIAEFGNRDRLTTATSTTSTANAVGVVFGFHRQAVVDHVGDRWHVQTASGDVGSDQNLHAAITKSHQTAIAQTLAQSAMQCHGAEAFLHQIVGQTVALNLRAGKHHGLVDGRVTQPVVEQLALVRHIVSPQQRLRDGGVLVLRRIDLETLWLAHDAGGQLHDARRKSSAEHHGLATLQRELVDFGQVIGKAEVQHAVGFVDHQELNLVQFDLHAALQVEQTAGGGHHQIGVLQLSDLQLVRNTTDHVGHAQTTAMTHQVNRVSANLLSQFAGWAQDQGARGGSLEVACVGRVFALWFLERCFAFGDGFGAQALKFSALLQFSFFLLLEQGVQHGQQKRGGFAAAGLAGDQQIGELGFTVRLASFEGLHGFRDGGHLHGGRLGETHIGHSLQKFLSQAQFHKTVGFGDDGF